MHVLGIGLHIPVPGFEGSFQGYHSTLISSQQSDVSVYVRSRPESEEPPTTEPPTTDR
jgi:hypothetical protein